MTDETARAGGAAARGGGGRGLLLGAFALSLLLGGGSFYAVYSGMVTLPFAAASAPGEERDPPSAPAVEAGPPPAFVPLDPLVVSLGPQSEADHLKVTVTIETPPGEAEAVSDRLPRIADVLNTFLRAVDEGVFEDPAAIWPL